MFKLGQTVVYDGIDQPENAFIETGEHLVITSIKYNGHEQEKAYCKNQRGQELIVRTSLLNDKSEYQSRKKNRLESLELLEWAMHRIERCQQEQFYGTLSFIFENGKIVRSKTEKSEVPN